MKKICSYFLIPILIMGLSFVFYREFEIYDMIELDSQDAKCLDGSNYQFYYKKSTSSKNFILFFDGGGWCSDKVYKNSLESCVKRTSTYLGSNNYFLNKIFHALGKYPHFKRWMYFLSNDETHNPDFHNYNKIILKYCDGRGFVGFNQDPIYYDGVPLYFRGHNNTMEVIKYGRNLLDLDKAENIIVAGMSAGGLASLLYSNYFAKEIFPKSVSIRTISDSSVFFEFQNVDQNNSYSISSIWKDLLKETKPQFPNNFLESYCKYRDDELYKCFLPEYFVEEIIIPVFIILPLYDSYSILTFVGDNCKFKSNDFCYRNQVEKYKEKIVLFFEKNIKNKINRGGFFPRCFVHDFLYFSFDWESEKVMIDGLSLRETIGLWLQNHEAKKISNGEGIEERCQDYNGIFYYLAYFEILMDIF